MSRCVRKYLLAAAIATLGCAETAPIAALPTLRAPMPAGKAEDWPMFRDDVERSGFAEGTKVGSEVSVLWQRPGFNTTAYGAVKGSPAVVGEMIYCGTDTGRFLAAHIDDGEVVWHCLLYTSDAADE